MFVRMGDKGTLIHCWWECELGSHCGKQYGSLSTKLKIKLSYDPAIPILAI
jgi:hypothetical protein